MARYRSIANPSATVTITVDGRALEVPYKQSLLAAMLTNGVASDFQCAIGQCQRCLVRVNGRVEAACLYVPKGGDIVDTSGASST